MEPITLTLRVSRDSKEVKTSTPKTMSSINLLPGAISEILANAAETGVLTLADRYGLMAAALDESLDEEERLAVNRLLRFIVKGRVKVGEQNSKAA